MRFGFFLGFLIGSAIASLIEMSKDDSIALENDGGPLDQLKRQAREARVAGREAAVEKEAEVMRDWEHETHHRN
jgi:hypothetical protein